MKPILLYHWCVTCLFVLLLAPYSIFSQTNAKITKYTVQGNQKIKNQELLVKNGSLQWEINYAGNGWQVIDSIAYAYMETGIKAACYEPVYHHGQTLLRYNLRKDKLIVAQGFNLLSGIGRRDFLLKDYIAVWNTLMELQPELAQEASEGNVLRFEPKIKPSILSRYGIPFYEVLDSCVYMQSMPGQLAADSFYFENYTVQRIFSYDSLQLTDVDIRIYNRPDGKQNIFREIYIVEEQ
jgi:hypothetical protein